MFERFFNFDIDSAGSGGEYTVQAGFGWTNGVALWIANTLRVGKKIRFARFWTSSLTAMAGARGESLRVGAVSRSSP